MNNTNAEILIKGKNIYLRKLSDEDATERYCSWLNDTEVNRYIETKSATVESIRNYIKEKNMSKNCIFLGIFNIKNNLHKCYDGYHDRR